MGNFLLFASTAAVSFIVGWYSAVRSMRWPDTTKTFGINERGHLTITIRPKGCESGASHVTVGLGKSDVEALIAYYISIGHTVSE